jgi:hypothetical protein
MANTKIPVELSSTPGIVDNSNATAITIDSSKNVGIGTSSPSGALEVVGGASLGSGFTQSRSGHPTFGITNGGTDSVYFSLAPNGGSHQTFMQVRDDDIDVSSVAFSTSGTERLRIDSSGNVGIGTSSPVSKLNVGTANATAISISTPFATNNYGDLVFTTEGTTTYNARIRATVPGNGTRELSFITAKSASENTVMTLDGDGNVGIGTSSPSARLTVDGGTSADQLRLGTDPNYYKIGRNSVSGPLEFYGTQSGVTGYVFGGVDGERMRINSSGSVEVKGGQELRVYRGDNATYGSIKYLTGSGGLQLNDKNGDGISFVQADGATEYGRFDGSGNLLVGATSTSASDNGIKLFGQSGSLLGSISLSKTYSSGTITYLYFERDSGSVVGSISYNGSATAYNTSSDARLKDITGEARGLEVINKLNPVAYNWKADGQADEGLIAQEVLDIVPNAVSGSEEDMYQMDYSKLVVHLVAGMKEQQTIIESLEARITALES